MVGRHLSGCESWFHTWIRKTSWPCKSKGRAVQAEVKSIWSGMSISKSRKVECDVKQDKRGGQEPDNG